MTGLGLPGSGACCWFEDLCSRHVTAGPPAAEPSLPRGAWRPGAAQGIGLKASPHLRDASPIRSRASHLSVLPALPLTEHAPRKLSRHLLLRGATCVRVPASPECPGLASTGRQTRPAESRAGPTAPGWPGNVARAPAAPQHLGPRQLSPGRCPHPRGGARRQAPVCGAVHAGRWGRGSIVGEDMEVGVTQALRQERSVWAVLSMSPVRAEGQGQG